MTAMELLRGDLRIDAAVLDINLQGEMVFPVADALYERGVCFIFATGYNQITVPERYAHIVRCEKPFHPNLVFEALEKACA